MFITHIHRAGRMLGGAINSSMLSSLHYSINPFRLEIHVHQELELEFRPLKNSE